MSTLQKPDEIFVLYNQIHCLTTRSWNPQIQHPFAVESMSSFGMSKMMRGKIGKLYVTGRMAPKCPSPDPWNP